MHSASLLKRREFLEAGARFGTALMAAPYLGRAARPADTVNIALIGCGEQGRVLLNAAVKIPGIRFRAVCDIWDYHRIYGQRLLQRLGHDVRVFADYRELLAEVADLDAVLVATPDFWHAEHTNASLRAGKHVYCEKLMAHTIEAARSMVHTARATGKLLQIGHQRRSNPRYQYAREKLLREARLLGRLTQATGQWNRAVAADLGFPARYPLPETMLEEHGYASMREFRNWRWFRRYSGGPISDLGAHQIDVFNWFLECHPRSVLAGGGRDYYAGREWYDNVTAIYEFPTSTGIVRATYQVLTTTSAGGGYHEYFMGDEGALKMSENPKYTKLFREAHAADWEPWAEKGYLVPPGQSSEAAGADETSTVVDARETAELAVWDLPITLDQPIHQPHLENFFAAIRQGVPLSCPAETAFATTATVLRVNEAIEARKMLAFTERDFVA